MEEQRSRYQRYYDSTLSVVLESLLTGGAVGFVVGFFRLALEHAETLRSYALSVISVVPWTGVAGVAAAFVALGLFLGWTSKRYPMIKGSGIPQLEGALHHQVVLNWRSELPMKLLTGILGLGAGLSLGREGPSIQIGAYVGKGILSVFHRNHRERHFLVMAAAAGGVSAAFNAPLAGVFFVVEELRAPISPVFLACAIGTSAVANLAAEFMAGSGPVFDFTRMEAIGAAGAPWVLLLGILCAFVSDIFKRSLYVGLRTYDRLRVPQIFRPVVPLLAAIALAFVLPEILGGGESLIKRLPVTSRSLSFLLILLAAKILFTALCYGTGTSGGIFLPFLCCGALTGAAFGKTLSLLGVAIASRSLNFVILGMAAFFTAVVGAPLTGMVLILEMSGNFNHMGNLLLVCLSAFVTSNLIGSRPVYEVLLERLLGKSGVRP